MIFTYTPTGDDWLRILPELAMLAAALLVLLADLAAPEGRKGWLALVGLAGVVAAGICVAAMFVLGDGLTAFYGMIASDWTALLADAIILFAAGLGVLFSPAYLARFGVVHVGEYYALLLLSALGMMLMASGTNLMVVFVGLEILSLALYILSAFLPGRERSQEAGMKYFLLSSFASAFLLYGMALTYGSTGTTFLLDIRTFLDAASPQFYEWLRADAARRAGPHGRRLQLQGLRDPLPGVDPGCLRRRAHAGDCLHVRRNQGRRVRRDCSHLPLRAASARRAVDAGLLGAGGADDDRGQSRRPSPSATSSACWPTPASPMAATC